MTVSVGFTLHMERFDDNFLLTMLSKGDLGKRRKIKSSFKQAKAGFQGFQGEKFDNPVNVANTLIRKVAIVGTKSH